MPQHNQVPEGEANINGRLGLIEQGIEKLQQTLDAHCKKKDDNAKPSQSSPPKCGKTASTRISNTPK